MIDNGRYALEVLSENLQLAGFYGARDIESSIATAVNTAIDPCTVTLTDMRAALGLHVAGYEAGTATSTIASPPCGLAAAGLKAGSDILVLRRVDTSAPVAQTAAINGIHYIQVSRCQ
jgi:type IV pilus assembly protein PilW